MAGNFHPFRDMKESAKTQHEVDRANFAAVKAESKATFEEAKLSPKAREKKAQTEREEQLRAAKARQAAAEARIDAAQKAREKNTK